MCGIAGFRRLDGHQADVAVLRAMTGTLAHRGPDAEGFAVRESTGLGHRRLAIIDLGGSEQPMHTAAGQTLSFNGEILNFRGLRASVPGYDWQSQGDTEVILALHQRYGLRAPAQLEGQFAYAIDNQSDGSLTLVRDRLGVLPLYYYLDASVFAFASEVKALAPVVKGGLQADQASLDDYLSGRAVRAPYTMFKNVRKVLPGEIITLSAEGEVTHQTYWHPADIPPASVSGTDVEVVRLVRKALGTAVAANLVADVPVGAYLSGGLDSSLIVALMNDSVSTPVKTFTADFGDPRFDEGLRAQATADFLRTDHTTVRVRPQEFAANFQALTLTRDAPLSEPADVALFRLASSASQAVKVVLSGEGADELFGGYPKHRLAGLSSWANRIPHGPRSWMARQLLGHLPADAGRARVAARALSEVGERAILRGWFAPFDSDERRALLRPGVPVREPASAHPLPGSPLHRMLVQDLREWLPDNLLERGDRMTMAASIELRPPFLHPAVVDLGLRLPDRFKVRRGVSKWVLREVARPVIPAAVLDAPKIGFKVPLDQWFREGLNDLVVDTVLSPNSFVGSILDPVAVSAIWGRHLRREANEEIRIWTLLSLENWHRATFASTGST